ncbi:uncharacterized protein RHIMIDRAFT_238859 [Rhizopus microsporus ATCC 52813]|uniref:Uncharacterized protein n=1 Tax=Rhizopus microsporus ATCC 52813 TaxID=1340429 RepID=A0A2G4SRQ1_RHIZD|nr:uncharacterized protein RHIMIDRAFT_238859 [Rhizopus microsporus ATCC 52813]PHZ11422.1 hypothetical protein RHIMIDRAFT_238859 [Rhizopus microsporus ATCC 52813]
MEDCLKSLIHSSKRIASVAFVENDDTVLISNEGFRKRLREADSFENAIHSICFGEESIQKITSEIPTLKGNAHIKAHQAQHLLNILRQLNGICKDQSIQRVIEEYTKTIEERESHMATLYSEYNEADAHIDALQDRISAEKSRATEMPSYEYQENLIRNLKQQLSNIDKKREENQKKRARKQEELQRLLLSNQESRRDPSIEALQARIRQMKERIKEYDNLLQQKPTTHVTALSTQDAFLGLKARFDKLVSEHSQVEAPGKDSLIEQVRYVVEQLRQTIGKLNTAEHVNHRLQNFKDIYTRLIDYTLDKSNSAHLNEEEFKQAFTLNESIEVLKNDSVLLAAIIRRLLETKQETVSDLTEYTKAFAEERQIATKASQSIYLLVAAGLLESDRSQGESVIKITAALNSA